MNLKNCIFCKTIPATDKMSKFECGHNYCLDCYNKLEDTKMSTQCLICTKSNDSKTDPNLLIAIDADEHVNDSSSGKAKEITNKSNVCDKTISAVIESDIILDDDEEIMIMHPKLDDSTGITNNKIIHNCQLQTNSGQQEVDDLSIEFDKINDLQKQLYELGVTLGNLSNEIKILNIANNSHKTIIANLSNQIETLNNTNNDNNKIIASSDDLLKTNDIILKLNGSVIKGNNNLHDDFRDFQRHIRSKNMFLYICMAVVISVFAVLYFATIKTHDGIYREMIDKISEVDSMHTRSNLLIQDVINNEASGADTFMKRVTEFKMVESKMSSLMKKIADLENVDLRINTLVKNIIHEKSKFETRFNTFFYICTPVLICVATFVFSSVFAWCCCSRSSVTKREVY
uniref:RING-type domain-containing protein n=1 Tax=Rhabditophanes sp. KR3021 TaxID=114890 RepID=A0AC35TJD1_9BILA